MKNRPAFVKVFIAEIDNNHLKIPVAFTRRIQKALPEKVYLRDRCNNMWIVMVAQVEDAWYFSDGWVTFVDDNLVTSGDLLAFEYFCHNLFNVKIYGPSAVEKKVEKKRQVLNDDDETGSQDFNFIFKKRPDNVAAENEDDNDDEETEDVNYGLMRHQEHDHEHVNNTAGGGTGVRNKHERLECYGMEIFRAGQAQPPQNPYFVTKIMPKRKSDLFIPRDVIKDNKLELMTQEMLLVDPRGREFKAKCKKWKDGRVIVSGGWRSLCRLNFVEEDDICICEFLRQEHRLLHLNVSFVRANIEEATRLQDE